MENFLKVCINSICKGVVILTAENIICLSMLNMVTDAEVVYMLYIFSSFGFIRISNIYLILFLACKIQGIFGKHGLFEVRLKLN